VERPAYAPKGAELGYWLLPPEDLTSRCGWRYSGYRVELDAAQHQAAGVPGVLRQNGGLAVESALCRTRHSGAAMLVQAQWLMSGALNIWGSSQSADYLDQVGPGIYRPSCTNSRIEDLRAAARGRAKGRKVSPSVTGDGGPQGSGFGQRGKPSWKGLDAVSSLQALNGVIAGLLHVPGDGTRTAWTCRRKHWRFHIQPQL